MSQETRVQAVYRQKAEEAELCMGKLARLTWGAGGGRWKKTQQEIIP